MTVSELIQVLQKMPQDVRVCVRDRDGGNEDYHGYDEAAEVQQVLPPDSPENGWDKSAVMIL